MKQADSRQGIEKFQSKIIRGIKTKANQFPPEHFRSRMSRVIVFLKPLTSPRTPRDAGKRRSLGRQMGDKVSSDLSEHGLRQRHELRIPGLRDSWGAKQQASAPPARGGKRRSARLAAAPSVAGLRRQPSRGSDPVIPGFVGEKRSREVPLCWSQQQLRIISRRARGLTTSG